MSADDLVALVCCDLGGVVRGRSLRASKLEAHLATGVGWVPANHALTPLGAVAEPNPFGSIGDLRLLPDAGTRVRVESDGAAPPLDIVLCDIVEPDGSPWRCCPRQFLRVALRELEHELGTYLSASFEHEFQLLVDTPAPLPFSLEAQRRAEPFATNAMTALEQAGVEPERVFPEYAAHQLEIPVAPASGMAAADRAVIFREVVRETARREGMRASFVPLAHPEEAGNGVHMHIDLLDAGGNSLLYDPARPGGLSELGGRFAAGVLRHARALSALTAPSPVSGARLRPHRWSAGAACLALASREALLRVPTPVTFGDAEQAARVHVEYRGADAAANPYLALGALLQAGMEGLREQLPEAPILRSDPADLDPEQAERFGVGALPQTLEEALRALAEDDTVRGWLSPLLYEGYVAIKRAELAAASGEQLEDTCRRYAAIY